MRSSMRLSALHSCQRSHPKTSLAIIKGAEPEATATVTTGDVSAKLDSFGSN